MSAHLQTPAALGSGNTDPAAGREALLTYWESRADSAEGDAVRRTIEDFLGAVVQRSAHPVTADEMEALNARRGCSRRFFVFTR